MATELAFLTVNTEEDIVHLHELSMQLGRWAGLAVFEQISFASEIVAHSHSSNNEAIEVGFSMEEIDNEPRLKVQIQNHSGTYEKRIYQ
ncbi:MAG: hypothetical protein ABIR18_13175, partial [Chitinophagaceae bacterium]